jgi:farnesyl diphosphate synthase
MSLSRYQQQVREVVDEYLQQTIETLPEHAPRLKKAMVYALLMGGKRMRPFLVFACGEMLGLEQQELVTCAAAIEAIHAYSLVHDDLPAMDDDELRRGKPTCHIQFDEATAILAGDALQSFAFELLCTGTLSANNQAKRVDLLRILSRAAGYSGMCGGQAMDIAATNQNIDQNQLELLHSKKTGALIEACIDMPLVLADNVDTAHQERLREYAKIIGLAFQVRDDILDVISDSDTLGKPQGSDQALAKSTYPALLGLARAETYLHSLHQQALQALRALPYNTQILESFTDFVIERKF